MSEIVANTHPVRESIGKHQIRSIAVVDDAIDAVSLDSFQEGEDQEFVAAVNGEDTLLKEFHKLAGRESSETINRADLTNEMTGLLWEKRKDCEGLAKVLSETLFRVLELKKSQVEDLCVFLRDRLGISDIQRFGTQSDIPNTKFDVAFIDYRFGPSNAQTSVDRAVHWATELYGNGRTFIILMSADAAASGSQGLFRSKSKLTRGLFEFLDKKEITDDGKFCNRLNSFCAGLDTRHNIHEFASAAEAAVKWAGDALTQEIHSLGLEDYAYLEQISLREDGHPLGDYVLWLFGEYFAHTLVANGSIEAPRKRVNGLMYEGFLPLQRPPSLSLAKMYSAAITEPVYEGWDPHPRETPQDVDESKASVPAPAERAPADNAVLAKLGGATSSAPPSTASGMQLYQLGDLLVADKDKPVYLVLNAGCDLQFSPGSRECDVDQSILLLPGRFEPLHKRSTKTDVIRTELFELNDERFRIIWEYKRAKSVPHSKVRAEYEKQGYVRRTRLKQPYALEIQQHFAAQLTRVGVPVPAPVFQELPVEAYGKDANGDYILLGTMKSGVVLFHDRAGDQFALTVDCVQEVLDHIDRFLVQSSTELGPVAKAQSPPDDASMRRDRRHRYLMCLKDARDVLANGCRFQTTLSALPSVGDGALEPDQKPGLNKDKPVHLEVRRAVNLSGRFKGKSPVVLTFSLPDVVIVGSTVVRAAPKGPEEDVTAEVDSTAPLAPEPIESSRGAVADSQVKDVK